MILPPTTVEGCMARVITLKYTKKEGTKGRYVRVSGPEDFFPKTIGFTTEMFGRVRGRGKANIHTSIGQIRGEFRKSEVSQYCRKSLKRPRITFSIWKSENPEIYGFADIGFAYGDGVGQVQSSEDLVIVKRNAEELEFYIFRGVYFNNQLRKKIIMAIR